MTLSKRRFIPLWVSNTVGWLWRNVNLWRLARWVLVIAAGVWIYQNSYKDTPLEQLTTRYGYPDATWVEVDGMEVYTRSVGQGEPIILLHDANSSMHTWQAWVDTLSKKYRVIVPDLPGYGLTGPHARGSYSLFMYTGFLDSFAHALQLKQFHLVGNGLGAQIAWFYASEHPNQVKKLILLDSPGFEEPEKSILDQVAKTPLVNQIYWYLTPKSLFNVRLDRIYADDQLVTDSLVNRHFELALRAGNRKAYTDRSAVRENNPPVSDAIKKNHFPNVCHVGSRRRSHFADFLL